MVHTQSTTEELQQVKKNLQRIYKDLDSAEQNNKMYEKQSHKEVDETINRALKNTSYTINATDTASAVSEKAFDYKKTAHDFVSPSYTQYLLIDILREECLVLQQKLADTLEYNHLLTESNAQSIHITQAASASAKDADYKLTVNQLISPLTTQYLLIDVVREECLAIQKKLIHNLEYIDLLTQSNAESVALSKRAR